MRLLRWAYHHRGIWLRLAGIALLVSAAFEGYAGNYDRATLHLVTVIMIDRILEREKL